MTDTTQPDTNSPSNTSTVSVFEQLVGPGKKFQTPEDLARGKDASDKFIEKMERENADLRKFLNEQDTRIKAMEAKSTILDRLNGDEPSPVNNQPHVPSNPTPATTVEKGLSSDDVLRLIENRDSTRTALNNVAQVDKILSNKLGAEAVSFIKQKAHELGISTDDLQALAAKSPVAFFNTVGLTDTSTSSQNSMYSPTGRTTVKVGDTVRNQSYYEGLKLKMGVRAFVMDKGIQVQMHKDMTHLGDAWEQ